MFINILIWALRILGHIWPKTEKVVSLDPIERMTRKRRLHETFVGNTRVSTIEIKAGTFETVVFGGQFSGFEWGWDNRLEASRGHLEVVRCARQGRDPMAYLIG